MNFKKIDESPKTFILVFQTGDELATGLLQFANEQKLSAASFKAIGALSSVRLGWLSWEKKKYEPSVTLDEQVELLSLIGDVALKDGEPVVHAHAVIGTKDGMAHGGHLTESAYSANMRSRFDRESCPSSKVCRSKVGLGAHQALAIAGAKVGVQKAGNSTGLSRTRGLLRIPEKAVNSKRTGPGHYQGC